MVLRSMILGAALAALPAAPAFAQEPPKLDPLKACYVAAQENQTELVDIVAHGFTARSTIDIYVDETTKFSAPVLLNGDVSGHIPAPFVDAGEREFTVRLVDPGNPAKTVSTVSRVTRFSVEQVPKSAKTEEKVHFRGRGFTLINPDTGLPWPVYAHYVFGGKALKTINLGIPKGPCGTFNIKRRQFPFKKRPRVGTWTIQFDQLSYYNPAATVQVPMQIKVRRAPKRPRAR
jgi:hypothetical protein